MQNTNCSTSGTSGPSTPSAQWLATSTAGLVLLATLPTSTSPSTTSCCLPIPPTAHCYDPYNFTLQPYADDGSPIYGPQWGHSKDGEGAEELYIINQFAKLRAKYIDNNIPCYLGEYGCVWKNSDYENAYRAYYLEFVCRAAHVRLGPQRQEFR